MRSTAKNSQSSTTNTHPPHSKPEGTEAVTYKWEIEEPFGPNYNVEGAALQKFRRQARGAGSLSEMLPAHRRAYGEAVEKAVLAKQRSALFGALEPERKAPCASGTWHSDGAKISAAVRAQQAARLQASAAADRRNRTPAQWAAMYRAAMREKAATLQLAA